jgi:hypothetical protein
MGQVFRATDTTGRTAIKISNEDSANANREPSQRSIIPISARCTDGPSYLVMELIEGKPWPRA